MAITVVTLVMASRVDKFEKKDQHEDDRANRIDVLRIADLSHG